MIEPSLARRLEVVRIGGRGASRVFGADVRRGLARRPMSIPCRYLYDKFGSQLFEEICRLPDYYLTRTELAILRACAGELPRRFDGPADLVELGSGSASKTRLLIDAFIARHGAARYVPIDISPTMLEASAVALLRDYPALDIRAVAGDYESGLAEVDGCRGRPKLVLWLGSTAGNLSPAAAAEFLSEVRRTLQPPDRLLLGIDLLKPRDILERAYADREGVTARFNLNLLARINRELGGEFHLDAFRHRAFFDATESRVDMRLVSLRDQRVRIRDIDLEVCFSRGETIHTESSHKYTIDRIDALARRAGLATIERWLDEQLWFSLSLLAPAA